MNFYPVFIQFYIKKYCDTTSAFEIYWLKIIHENVPHMFWFIFLFLLNYYQGVKASSENYFQMKKIFCH